MCQNICQFNLQNSSKNKVTVCFLYVYLRMVYTLLCIIKINDMKYIYMDKVILNGI